MRRRPEEMANGRYSTGSYGAGSDGGGGNQSTGGAPRQVREATEGGPTPRVRFLVTYLLLY